MASIGGLLLAVAGFLLGAVVSHDDPRPDLLIGLGLLTIMLGDPGRPGRRAPRLRLVGVAAALALIAFSVWRLFASQ